MPPETKPLTAEQQALLKGAAKWSYETAKLRKEGKLEEAIVAAQKMLAAEVEEHGELHDDPIGSMTQIAECREKLEQFVEARKVRERILELQTKRFGKDALKVIEARLAVENIDVLKTNTPKAKERLKERDRLWAESRKLVADGKSAEAAVLVAKVMEIEAEVFGADHRELDSTALDLTKRYSQAEDWPAARRTVARLLAAQIKRYGERSWQATDSRVSAAEVEKLAGMTAEELAFVREAERKFQQAFELVKASQPKEALPILESCRKIYSERFGEDSNQVANLDNYLGTVHDAAGDSKASEAAHRRSLAVRRKVLGAEHPYVALSLTNIGLGLVDRKDTATAEPLLREAAALRKKVFGEQSAEHVESLLNLGAVFRTKGDAEAAKEVIFKAFELTGRRLGDKDDPMKAQVINQAGLLLYQMKEYDAAEAAFREAATVWAKTLGRDHPNALSSRRNLVAVHERQLEIAVLSAGADEIEKQYRGLAANVKLGQSQAAAGDAKAADATRAAIRVSHEKIRGRTQVDSVTAVSQVGHANSPGAVTFSADSRLFATGGDDGAVVWDVASGSEIRRFPGGGQAVAFSPDGRWLAVANHTHVAVWEVGSGRELYRIVGHEKSIRAVAFSPNGKYVATASDDNTARIWDAATGAQLRAFSEPDAVTHVAFPSNERIVTANRDGNARIWDAAESKLVHRLVGHKGGLVSVAASSNGTRVLTGGSDGTYRVWDADTGKELGKETFRDSINGLVTVAWSANAKWIAAACDAVVQGVPVGSDSERGFQFKRSGRMFEPQVIALSPDGKWLAAVDTPGVRMMEIATRHQPRDVAGLSSSVNAVAFSPDGRSLLVCGGDRTAWMWDVRGPAARRLPDGRWLGGKAKTEWHGKAPYFGHDGPVMAVAYSHDGKLAATAAAHTSLDFKNPDGEVILWDAITGVPQRKWKVRGSAYSVAVSPDGTTIAAGVIRNTGEQSLFLWDTATGAVKPAPTCDMFGVYWLAFSPDGKHLLAAGSEKTGSGTRVWSLESRRELRRWDSWMNGTFLPDGGVLVGRHGGSTWRVLDPVTGAVVRRIGDGTRPVYSEAVSADGRRAVALEKDRAEIWDVPAGKVIATVVGPFGDNVRAALSRDGKLLAVAAADQSTHLFDAASGKHLCRLVSFTDNTWAVVDPLGRYDASNGGDVAGLHWVVGNEPIALSQLKERYYDPGLLGKLLGSNREPLRAVAAFTAPKMYPDIVAKTTGAKIDVALTNRGGGIGRVVVLVNGKEASSDARPRGADPEAAKLTVQLDLSNDPRLEPGKKNRVEILAYNAEGYLCSRGMVREIEPEGEKKADPPELWAVIVGVSDYRGDAIDLKFAAKDADDFATAVRVAGNRLFGADHVHLTKLTTTGDVKAYPNRANILLAMEALKKAKPGDVMVIYLAGHGVNYGGADGDFYYLTSDAATANLADPAVRTATAVSSKELTELLKLVPAQKQVLILDTCASGKLVEKLMEKRDVPGSQVRAMEQLKDRTGMYVLAGCASDAVSYEASRYGQGLLTYSLLLGMRGGALKDERVDVATLFGFAADKVPELARDIGGVQRPVIATPRGGQPFPIGVVTAKDQTEIPLQTIRPMLLRCNLQEEDEFKDVLDLGKKVDEVLKSATGRGRTSPLVFIDASELPGAHQLAGRYRIDGDAVVVTAILFRGKERVGRVSVKGEKGKPAELAASLAAEVEKALSTTTK